MLHEIFKNMGFKYNDEELLSIKKLFSKISLSPEVMMKTEYRKSNLFLMELINKTEKVLIKQQKEDGCDVFSDRQKSLTRSLNGLIVAYNKSVEMEGLIYNLNKKIELLENRLKLQK